MDLSSSEANHHFKNEAYRAMTLENMSKFLTNIKTLVQLCETHDLMCLSYTLNPNHIFLF